MSFAGGSRHAVLLAAVLLIGAGPLAANDAAHKLAEKFAGSGQTTPEQTPEALRKAEDARKKEAERLAQEALKEEARKRAEAALKAERQKQRPVAKKSETPAKTPDAGKAEEADMLARAREEAEQRQAAELRSRTDAEARRVIEEAEQARRQLEELLAHQNPPPAATPAAQPSAPAPAPVPVAEPSAPVPSPAEQEQARRQEAEAALQAGVARARRIWRQSADRIEAHARAAATAAEEERRRVAAQAPAPSAQPPETPPAAAQPVPPAVEKMEAKPAAAPPTIAAAPPAAAPVQPVVAPEANQPPQKAEPSPAISASAPPAAAAMEPRVTVLIVMQPGTYGIRKNNKTADPLLCTHEGCYISAGADVPANFLPGRRALGIGNTWGGRAGACRNQLGCVFRAIPVREMPLLLQPVDMHVLKHDRRRPQAILADSQCRVEGARLSCARGIYAEDYTLWIVPESVATAAGPTALERAVTEGLNGPRSAALHAR